MQRQQHIEELKTLMDLVDRSTTALAERVMEIDVKEYYDPDQFQREKNELFRNYPQFVGPSCMIPEAGDYFAFDDTGIPILIVRHGDGALHRDCQEGRAQCADPRRHSARRTGDRTDGPARHARRRLLRLQRGGRSVRAGRPSPPSATA